MRTQVIRFVKEHPSGAEFYRCLETQRLTLWGPDEPNSQKVLQVVEQNVFDLEVLLHCDGAWTAGCHDEPWSVQTDTRQPVGERNRKSQHGSAVTAL